MPRARTKSELLMMGKESSQRLLKYFCDTPALANKVIFDDRTGTDILAHIVAWHKLFLIWYAEGMSGKNVAIPAVGYTFKTTPALNELLYQQYKDMSFAMVESQFLSTYREIMTIIESHTDADLVKKKFYKWTGTTNLASYLASTTSSHYQWAIALLRKA
jgi:hypothetical protein